MGKRNEGDDIAGFAHKAGSRQAIAMPSTCSGWHSASPNTTSFEEAAAIPLPAMMAPVGLYIYLGLPQPFTLAKKQLPLILCGAASAVGAYAVCN